MAASVVDGKTVPFLSVNPQLATPDFYAVGGDFGDKPNDGNFVLTGLLNSDGTSKPAYFEVAKVNQPFRVRAVDLAHGIICVENRNTFTELNNFVMTWEWSHNGVVVAKGTIPPLPCGPSKSIEFSLPPPSSDSSDERYLTVRFALAKNTAWADAGFIVAWDQLALNVAASLPAPELKPGRLTVEQSDQAVIIGNASFYVRIGRQSGMIESLSYGGRELLTSPLHLCFWRPPVTNDRGWKMPEILGAWHTAGEQTTATSVAVRQNTNGTISISAELKIPVASSHATLNYQIAADGKIIVNASVATVPLGRPAPMNEVPRVGMQCGLISTLHQIEWFGLGPDESYLDRKDAARFGIFNADAITWNHNYQPPQETGHRSEVRRAAITSPDGQGLVVRAIAAPFGLNLWPWTSTDLETTDKPQHLKPRNFLTLTIDSAQMGLGGVQGWGAHPLDKYLLSADKTYQFSFTIEPLKKIVN